MLSISQLWYATDMNGTYVYSTYIHLGKSKFTMRFCEDNIHDVFFYISVPERSNFIVLKDGFDMILDKAQLSPSKPHLFKGVQNALG